jgi:hypothetical protein
VDFAFNLLEGVLELLDLDHRGVGQGAQKSEGLID